MYNMLYAYCTTTWVSSKCTYICSLLSLPPIPPCTCLLFCLVYCITVRLAQPAAAFDRWWWTCPGPSPWTLFSTYFQTPHSWSSSCFSGCFSASFVDSFLAPWPHLGGPEAQALNVFSNYIHPLNGFMLSHGCIYYLHADRFISLCQHLFWTPDVHVCSQADWLYEPMDCRLPGSFVHGIFQARILEWVAIPFPGDLPNPGIEPTSLASPALAGIFFTTSDTWEA